MSQIRRVNEVLRLIDAVAHPALSVVLDTFHLWLEEPEAAAAIMRCQNYITAVQLGDTFRGLLGTGNALLADYVKALQTINFRGPWILECSSQLANPSLYSIAIDIEAVVQELEASLQWLQVVGTR